MPRPPGHRSTNPGPGGPNPNPDKEFGVPFPGKVLPQTQWAQTALKAMPSPGPIDWPAMFGRVAPVILDLGCGNGRYSISSALTRPDHDHLGVDTLPVVIRYARKRGNQRGCANLRFAVLGGHELLERFVPAGTVAEVHCYHPQPFYDPKEVHRRLVTPNFLALVHQVLTPGGLFVVQTDNPGYWKYIREVVPAFFEFSERIGRWPDGPRGRTRREILAIKKGLPVFRATAARRDDITPADALRAAENLPPPLFDADRRLRDLDRLA